MRGARRLAIAALAAGLWLAPSAAPAQDATRSGNQRTCRGRRPKGASKLQLSGNVTRPADQPPARTPPQTS